MPTPFVSRGTEASAICPIHGDISSDCIRLEYRHETPVRYVLVCVHCVAKASGFKPWLYSGSPHGSYIEALGIQL